MKQSGGGAMPPERHDATGVSPITPL
jgi:hypothetical protein